MFALTTECLRERLPVDFGVAFIAVSLPFARISTEAAERRDDAQRDYAGNAHRASRAAFFPDIRLGSLGKQVRCKIRHVCSKQGCRDQKLSDCARERRAGGRASVV